jgi:UDP-N-acetylglucosamine 1-carboxyvinyltransferase
MSYLVIKGGQKLKGEVKISGSKNTALKIIAATLLNKGKNILINVPKISDVLVILEILEYLGCKIIWENNKLIIDSSNIKNKSLIIDAVKKLRASVVLLGPMLSLFKEVEIARPGGDIIGARSIGVHLNALRDLGCEIQENENVYAKFKKITNNFVILKEMSVTATENLLLFLSLIPKKVKIRLAATEPSVVYLCKFLKKLGVEIKGIGTPFLEVEGRKNLKKKVIFKIPPDNIETGTFIALAGATKSHLVIKDIVPEELDAVLITMNEMNFKYKLKNKSIEIFPSDLKGTKIQVGLYPKFPSDLQPLFGALATQAKGVTLIHDWMYENRFSYINELVYMGANAEILDPHRAIIIGPTLLKGKEVRSLDIRAGAALIIAALVAHGESILYEAEKIERGYENIVEKLQKIGANIRKIEE